LIFHKNIADPKTLRGKKQIPPSKNHSEIIIYGSTKLKILSVQPSNNVFKNRWTLNKNKILG